MQIEKSWKYHSLTLFIVIFVLALDLVTKYVIESSFKLHETRDVFGSFFQLILIYNKGGVFGIAQGKIHYFLFISFFVLGFIVYTYLSTPLKSIYFRISIGMVLGGALGNMHDRIFNNKGVVDFIYVGWDKYTEILGEKILLRWPAFNIADSAILVGAIALAIILWRQERKKQPAAE